MQNTRLGIPAVIHEEAVAGFCARDAVQFPQAIGLGATFDVDLLERIGDHACNLAEDVIYMVEAEIVRHQSEG